MSTRNKKMDRRDRFMERRRMAELREAVADSFFEAFRAGRLMPARVVAANTFHWPAPQGER